jgi:hypothetical protein
MQSDRARALLLVALALLHVLVALWIASQAVAQHLDCDVCDTRYYDRASQSFAANGLEFTNAFDGYRSYFVPAFIHAIRSVSAAFLPANIPDAARYPLGVTLIYGLMSCLLVVGASLRKAELRVLLLALATVWNPLLFAYLPYQMQESALVFFCAPLVFALLQWGVPRPACSAVTVALFGLICYATRSALVVLLVPALLAFCLYLMRERTEIAARWKACAAALVGAIVLIGPQSLISVRHAGTLNPYPARAVLQAQFAWGVEMYKYATVREEGEWRGLPYFSPYATDTEVPKALSAYRDPTVAATLVLAHVYAIAVQDQLLPYWDVSGAAVITPWLLLSVALLFLGAARMVTELWHSGLTATLVFFAGSALVLLASAALIAAETRFGVLLILLTSAYATRWTLVDLRHNAGWLGGGIALLWVAAVKINQWMLWYADIAV